MSDSVRPHRWQAIRLPRPWDSLGKNTGWVATSFSNAWKWKVKVKLLSRVWLLVIPWTAAYQAPPSMGLSRQEYWSGVPSPSPILLLTKLKTRTYIPFPNCWLQLKAHSSHAIVQTRKSNIIIHTGFIISGKISKGAQIIFSFKNIYWALSIYQTLI